MALLGVHCLGQTDVGADCAADEVEDPESCGFRVSASLHDAKRRGWHLPGMILRSSFR